MGFEWLVPIVVVPTVFGFIALMVKWSLAQKRERIRAESGGSSLGTSELRNLIQDAMHDAIVPVEERLDRIEMNTRRLPEHDAETTGAEASRTGEPTED